MSDKVRIHLKPLGRTISLERGSALQDALFEFGVEFPCGGHGRCKACRVRVLEGSLPVTEDQASILTAREIEQGWRLACRSRASADVTLEVSQWDAPVLTDDSSLDIVPRPGLGVAVDLGTTTLVAQLVDLTKGKVLDVQTSLNPQAAHGADVMSRIQLALTTEGRSKLRDLIHKGIGRLLERLEPAAGDRDRTLDRIVIVGNSVMHHLFGGIDVSPLAYFPFEPEQGGLQRFTPDELGWTLPGNPGVLFLPCVGGFVGSDILAGILSTKMQASADLIGLIDLGTNGEVVFGNRARIVCASTAAGPAFEGARIRMGMRAATGAVSEVAVSGGKLRCHVIGGGRPRGICGSGLVDAVSAGLSTGVIGSSGRFTSGVNQWMLCPPVLLEQSDIRELQLAKGAIAAAVRLLLRRLDARPADVSRIYLAGAFGNYVDRESARRIGLLDFPLDKIAPAGNTALRGAKLALFRTVDDEYDDVISGVEHSSLSADPEFEDAFVTCMTFP